MKIVNNRLVKFEEIQVEAHDGRVKYLSTYRRYNENDWYLMLYYDEEHQLIDSKTEELEKLYQEYKSSTLC